MSMMQCPRVVSLCVCLSFDANELVEYEDENDAFAGGLIATLVSKVINACIGSNHDVDACVVVRGAYAIMSFV